MALTYLDIVNFVLHDTNETALTAVNFMQTRGFHSFVKEAVNRALMDIANESDEWPWLANLPSTPTVSSHSDVIQTDRRQAIYEFPENIMEVDWDSFVVVDMSKQKAYPLTPVSFEEWQRNHSAGVLSNRTAAELGVPSIIYKTQGGTGFGLSPVPDKDYQVQYIGWHSPALLTLPTDTLPFPDRYYTVLVNKARYYAWMFRENPVQSQSAYKDYDNGVRKMRQSLIKPIFNRMRAV